MNAKGIQAAKPKPLQIHLPPLAEQHRIVAKVDAPVVLRDQLQAKLTTTANTIIVKALAPADVAMTEAAE